MPILAQITGVFLAEPNANNLFLIINLKHSGRFWQGDGGSGCQKQIITFQLLTVISIYDDQTRSLSLSLSLSENLGNT